MIVIVSLLTHLNWLSFNINLVLLGLIEIISITIKESNYIRIKVYSEIQTQYCCLPQGLNFVMEEVNLN